MDERSPERGCAGMRIIEYHDFRTLLGPCFISFSLPLLVPGVVLTVVGSYGNDNWFPLYGGWHVTGIVILCIALLLLVSGIVLKCFFRPIISADIERHLTPTPSLMMGNKNLGYDGDDDVLVISSTGSKLNNKVAPNDPGEQNHVIVSTHEKRDDTGRRSKSRKTADKNTSSESRSSNAKHNRTSDKPLLVQGSQNVKKATSKDTQEKHESHAKPATTNPATVDKAVTEQMTTNHKQDSDRPDLATTIQNASGKNVTATMTMTVTTETTHEDNEQSSVCVDGPVMAKKHKKKKRKSSKMSVSKSFQRDSEEEMSSARTKESLPALRTARPVDVSKDNSYISEPAYDGNDHSQPKSVLVHDHDFHHQDQHVHFRRSPEVTLQYTRAPSPMIADDSNSPR